MDAQKLEQIQKVFANDRFATDNGAVIEQVDEGYAKCWLEIQPHHLNAAGTVMGGAIPNHLSGCCQRRTTYS